MAALSSDMGGATSAHLTFVVVAAGTSGLALRGDVSECVSRAHFQTLSCHNM